jgi:hypothetical protein
VFLERREATITLYAARTFPADDTQEQLGWQSFTFFTVPRALQHHCPGRPRDQRKGSWMPSVTRGNRRVTKRARQMTLRSFVTALATGSELAIQMNAGVTSID